MSEFKSRSSRVRVLRWELAALPTITLPGVDGCPAAFAPRATSPPFAGEAIVMQDGGR